MIALDYDDIKTGFAVGKTAAIREWSMRREIDDASFAKLCRTLLNKRTEAKRPEHYRELHAKASKAWRERNPERYAEMLAARKKRYRKRHPEKIKAANRATYLRWRAKPGNLEEARKRAAARPRKARP